MDPTDLSAPILWMVLSVCCECLPGVGHGACPAHSHCEGEHGDGE